MKAFWWNIPSTAFTAFATGSSVATIPANLEAARKTGVTDEVREVIIPLGATIHMEGSCLAAIVKIAFLFGLFQMPFAALPLITMIGTIVDPPATALNAVGDNVACLMVSRALHGPRWFSKAQQG